MKRYTWEEKIDCLAKLAKAAGVYLDVSIDDPGTDYHKDARRRLMDAYEEFCQWRHEEPYVVDEIKELLTGRREYTDELTGVRLLIEKENPAYPDHPKMTVICPHNFDGKHEKINEAMLRLQIRAGIPPEERMQPLYSIWG
ncbi:MAG TPA: hypothetical protein VFA10_17885 [Ktedonobacteraceae bacterium]|nr:hypothetical protein [Ktedonobacteraceae bacterium]